MSPEPRREPEVNKLFRLAWKHGASHLYLEVGMAPRLKIRGRFRAVSMPPSSQVDLESLLYPIMKEQQRQDLAEEGVVEFGHVVGKDECRFDCSVSKTRGQLSLVACSIG